MIGHLDLSEFCRVTELFVTSLLADQLPAVLFEEFYDLL